MPPLSYALLDEVLQYPFKPEERIEPDHNTNMVQNTNITEPNINIVKNKPNLRVEPSSFAFDQLSNFKEFFTASGSSTEQLLREQIFLTKLLIILLLFIFLMNLIKK